MTHHNTLLEKLTSSRNTIEKTRCNWCSTEANFFSEEPTEANFVPLEGKTLDGQQAYALYCPDCMKRKERLEDPKSAILFMGNEEIGFASAQVQIRDLKDADEEPVKTTEVTAEEYDKEEQKKKSLFGIKK